MSRIDRQRVVGKSEGELDELTCSICQEIFDDPVVTQCCRQTYCKECINQWLKTNNTCPNDRMPLSSNNLIQVPRILVNLLNKLTVKCENNINGCPSVLTIEEVENHMLICDYYSCNSCKTSKILLSEKQKENDFLRNQLKANENDLKHLNERQGTSTITQNSCERDLIITARTISSFQTMIEIGLTAEEKAFLYQTIINSLIANNSFGEVASSINENINNHHMLKDFNWITIVGLEYNATFVGQFRLCIKFNNGLKVIIIGYK